MSSHHEVVSEEEGFKFLPILTDDVTGIRSITVSDLTGPHVVHIIKRWSHDRVIRRFNVVITQNTDTEYDITIAFYPDSKTLSHPHFNYLAECVLYYTAFAAIASAMTGTRTYSERSVTAMYLVRAAAIENENEDEEVCIDEGIYKGEWTLSLSCPLSTKEVSRVIGYGGSTIKGLSKMVTRTETNGNLKINITNSKPDSCYDPTMKISMWGENRGQVEACIFATYFASCVAMIG